MIRKRAIPLPLLACLLASVAMPAQATTLEEAIAAAMNHAPEIEAARAPASLSTVSVSQETSAMWDDEHSIQSLDRFAG